ncbi:penicillin-binding transpeptidase domain-containing protein [Amycolatopsis sp. NPDC058986]|uniref:penicillin-binding transpeptidase domain-containing protein n=1 Tax=unclassified Amycolatopsis TaxID=2618356 RepID=UPI00366CC436
MGPARKRGVLIGGAVGVVAIVTAAVVVLTSGNEAPASDAAPAGKPGPVAVDPTGLVTEYLQDLAEANPDAAGALTDDPAAAAVALRDARNALMPTKTTATLSRLDPTPAGAAKTSGTFAMTWTLRPGKTWTYDVPFELTKAAQGWRLHWVPALLHPKLEPGQRLVAATAPVDRPAVVDRDGKPLVMAGQAGNKPAEGNPAPLLQSVFAAQATTAKSDGFAVQRVDASGKNLETLYGQDEDGEGKPLTASLSVATQNAAQSAVDGYRGRAIMVVLQPSTGDILAVAQNAAAGTEPKAFSGLYAPGSTFKIVTATAALEQGLATADTALPCPGSDQIGTRTIPNENHFDKGTVPLHQAFAFSCNTTFGRLASRLPADGLVKAADQYGLNADFEIPGLQTEAGKVVPATGNDRLVEDGIGQGDVQVSPFGAALMAATAASGKAVTPKLWHGLDTTVAKPYSPPSAGVLNAVRSMMREVVTTGTGKAAGGAGQVHGKTGTAEFGADGQANGWFVGYRGDVAFAVLLEGANDSNPAVSLAATFLNAVH